MKSKLLAFGLAMTAIPAFAQVHSPNYNKSVFAGVHNIKPVNRGDAGTLQKAQQHFPGMYVSLDKLNGSFTDIFGKAIHVQGNTVESKLQTLFSNHLSALGVRANEWTMTANVAAPHARFVNYAQTIQGHKVVFADLKFRFTTDGRLERVKMKNYGKPGTLSPSITAAAAKQAAEQDINGVKIIESMVEDDWYWFPVPSASGYELRPAYAFNIKGEGETLPVDLVGYVDAITGKVLYRTNNVKESITQNVNGVVYKQNPQLPASTEPLANLKITINGTDYFTDTAGLLSISSLNTPVTATVKLEGKWARVRAAGAGNIVPSFQHQIITNGAAYTFDTASPSSIRHINAYYHVNKVHDFMKGFFPTFTAMDNPLQTNVDVPSATGCNAFYNGTSINFYTGNASCNSFALCADIIYHEYGHGISHRFYNFLSQSFDNGALGEGNSDIWGIGITNDPVLGKGGFVNPNASIRRYDGAPKVYPQDLVGEVHADGEIIAGAWWDLALNLNSTDTMSQLFALTYWDTPNGPNGTEGAVYHDVLISALINDDNDNNLNNGTPHFTQIVSAFAKHGIYLLGDAVLAHSEIAHQPHNTPVTINAYLTVTTPAYLQGVALYYMPRGGQWDTVMMTNTSGNTYTAQIPGQPMGTIIDYYFAIFDNQSVMNASFPLGFLPGNMNITTIPYQFATGIVSKWGTDFESALSSDWIVGDVSGDDATGGKWIHAKPIGSYVNGVTTSIPIQPNMDHTTGTTGKCLVTGNALTTGAQPGTADVDNGKTSVITPEIDITGFTTPIIEYWRWYSNNGGSNPGQDYWNVFIKDANSPFWFLRVDFTKATDNNWRRRIFKVAEFLPNAKKVMLKFMAEDANPASIVEAAVDDLFVYDEGVINTINDIDQLKASIYPNPASDNITIKLVQPASGYIALYDLSGKQLINVTMDGAATTYNINTSSFAQGTYFVAVKTGKSFQSHKVTIIH